MKFLADKNIFKNFPEVSIGIIILQEIDNAGNNGDIEMLLRTEEIKKKQALAGIELGSLPEIACWRQIYKGFGANPQDFRPSVEALLRRARGGERPLPTINKLVDIYNYLSLKYHLPIGAEDIDRIKGDIRLTFASGDEKGRTLGAKEDEVCDKGEVIYRDDISFLCRKWNWREADRTKITPNTKKAIVVVEKCPKVSEETFLACLDEAEMLLIKHLQAKTVRFIVESDNPEAELGISSTPERKEGDERLNNTSKKSVFLNKSKEVKKDPIQNPLRGLFDETLVQDKRKDIAKLVEFSLQEEYLGKVLKKDIPPIIIDYPKNENYGDYSSCIALVLAKVLKESPKSIAERLANLINKYIKENLSAAFTVKDKKLEAQIKAALDILENAEFTSSGFINFRLSRLNLITRFAQVIKDVEPVVFGQNDNRKTNGPLTGKKFIVEYAHPNTHKAFHIGHLRNITTGEAVARLLESQGAKVIRANYQGDVGMHIAKCLWSILKEPDLTGRLEKAKGIKEKVQILSLSYSKGSKAYEEDDKAKSEIADINYLIYAGAQLFQGEKGAKSGTTDYMKLVKSDKSLYEKVFSLWKETRAVSLEYFEQIYKKVGTKFDRYFFESECLDGVDIAKSAVRLGILSEDGGSLIFKGEKYGLDRRVFVNSLGLPTYEAKELALARKEFSEFGLIDKCIHVVGPEQASFFEVTFKVEELMDSEKFKGRQYHLVYGWVRLKKGKMSSRLGNVVLGEWLIDEAEGRIREIMDKVREKGTGGESNARKEENIGKIAVSAVKYSFLRVGSSIQIAFDMDESVSFTGDSGPYLLYTFARANNVLEGFNLRQKKQESLKDFKFGKEKIISILSQEEYNLLVSLDKFDSVLAESAKLLSANILCTYLYDLARKFNLFYNRHNVLNPDNDEGGNIRLFRLALTKRTADILKTGLRVLGIETVTRM